MSDESMEIKIMRQMAWERAKGELRSVLATYCRNENFSEADKLINSFIKRVEDEGLVE